jgi:hypothetical protein
MGGRIDGWADLIDNAGDRADALFQFVHQRLGQREMPQVAHYDQMLTTGGLMGEQRRYHLVSHQVGSTVAVYIGAFGKDLYVAWDLFVSQVWKWKTFAIIAGVAAVIAFIGQLDDFEFFGWLLSTIGSAISISILVGLAGLVLKRSFWAFFKEEYSHFRADDVTAMGLAIHHSLIEGLDYIGVDRALIRPKEQFRAGRRERII